MPSVASCGPNVSVLVSVLACETRLCARGLCPPTPLLCCTVLQLALQAQYVSPSHSQFRFFQRLGQAFVRVGLLDDGSVRGVMGSYMPGSSLSVKDAVSLGTRLSRAVCAALCLGLGAACLPDGCRARPADCVRQHNPCFARKSAGCYCLQTTVNCSQLMSICVVSCVWQVKKSVPRFLNRLLGLSLSDQKLAFGYFQVSLVFGTGIASIIIATGWHLMQSLCVVCVYGMLMCARCACTLCLRSHGQNDIFFCSIRTLDFVGTKGLVIPHPAALVRADRAAVPAPSSCHFPW